MINPHAGKGHAKRVGEQVETYLKKEGLPFRVFYTQYKRHAIALTQQCLDFGATHILVVGGDGTVHEVAQKLIGTDVILGIVPAGTGNDYARTFNLPLHPQQAVQTALHGTVKRVDVIRINESYCLNVASVGVDAQTNEETKRFKGILRGKLAYVAGALCAIVRYRPLSLQIAWDGQAPTAQMATMCVIANGKYYGGGFYPIAQADPENGRLDALVVDGLKKRQIPRLFLKYIRGTHANCKEAHFYQCQKMTLTCADAPLLLNSDGESYFLERCDISIVPHCLSLAVPV